MSEKGGGTATGGRERIEEKASEAYEAVRNRASTLVDDVRHQAETIAERQKGMMADRIDGVASAIRQAAGELSSQQQPTTAGYVEDVAEAVSGFSNTVRDRAVVDLAHDPEALAVHNPGRVLARTHP